MGAVVSMLAGGVALCLGDMGCACVSSMTTHYQSVSSDGMRDDAIARNGALQGVGVDPNAA